MTQLGVQTFCQYEISSYVQFPPQREGHWGFDFVKITRVMRYLNHFFFYQGLKNYYKENVRLVTEFKTPFFVKYRNGNQNFFYNKTSAGNKSPISKILSKIKNRNIQVATHLNDFEYQVRLKQTCHLFFPIGTSVSKTAQFIDSLALERGSAAARHRCKFTFYSFWSNDISVVNIVCFNCDNLSEHHG